MYERCRTLLLRWLKVPPEPHPPFGDPASLRVFRAGRNYFNLRLLGWGIGELFALVGIIFWVTIFVTVEAEVDRELDRMAQSATTRTNAPLAVTAPPAATIAAAPAPTAAGAKPEKKRARKQSLAEFKQSLVAIAVRLPSWAFPLIWALKIGGFALYLIQLPLTYAIRRLDYEMRWYVVTDRSLRIRTGVWSVRELTMSFANLQQVVVTQGPIQRLLGLADVRVQSAGGGSAQPGDHAHAASLHIGHFHGVDNATEIRDLILERLRRFRESGLGDPDEARRQVATPAQSAVTPAGELLAAAQELAAEARALRRAVG